MNAGYSLHSQVVYQLAKAHGDALRREAADERLANAAGQHGSRSSARGVRFVRLLERLAGSPASA